jgi:hypothetical protein
MIKTIWIMWKPGEERIYTMAVQPSEPWATKQKEDGFYIASFAVELPDPTVSSVKVSSVAQILSVIPVTLARGHIADQVVESIASLSLEEAAKSRPGVVIPVENPTRGLVALCGEFSLFDSGVILQGGIHAAQVSPGISPRPEECIRLYSPFEQAKPDAVQLACIGKLAIWWLTKQASSQPYPPSPGTLT